MSSKLIPLIRLERSEDIPAIRRVNELAFDQIDEADLIDTLRKQCTEFISLVAIIDEQVVGHLLFTPALLECPSHTLHGMGLAPMAVLPDYQNHGIGSVLVKTGIEQLDDERCPFIIVLGHPGYYPRFGFLPASRLGIACPWEAPDEAFMVRFPGAIPPDLQGSVARYRDEFNAATK